MSITIKVNSKHGIVETKLKQTFDYLGYKFAVVDYIAPKTTHINKRVVEYTTGQLIGWDFYSKTYKEAIRIAKIEIDLYSDELESAVARFEKLN